MSQEKENLDQIFALPFPQFLELLKTDAQAATTQFAEYARQWLLAHPTPSMGEQTAEEQQAIVEETIERCLKKEAEPLRNYTDAWGSFGAWLSSVAENTCATRARERQPKKRVVWMDEEAATPPPPPKPPTAGPAAGKAATITAHLTAAQEPPPHQTPVKTTRPKTKTRRADAPKKVPSPSDKPVRPVQAFFVWLRSPRIFIPIVLIIVAIFVIRGTRQSSRDGTRPYTPQPIDVVLMSESEVRRSSFDILPIPSLPKVSVESAKVPSTAIFRETRLVVLQLDVSVSLGTSAQTEVSLRDKSENVVWSELLDEGYLDSGKVYLRITPTTFAPDDYDVLVTDSGIVVARSAFIVR
jgi:DNA-directed RNA polymerase specialized sigma24 family protein